MSLPTQTQVLVVGAGPCGLACAVTLVSLGLEVTIVDSFAAGMKDCRATSVHAHTLEMLDTIGLAKTLMDLGIHANGMTFYGGVDKLLEINIAQFHDETKFSNILQIPQYQVESIFEQRLASDGVEVLRNRTAVGIKEIPGDGLQVSFEDGGLLRAQYIVGADGSRSTIRRLADINFADPDTGIAYDSREAGASELQMLWADVIFAEPIPESISRGEPQWHLNKPLLLLPLPSIDPSASAPSPTSFCRVGIVLSNDDSDPAPRYPDADYLQRKLDEINPWETRLTIASAVTKPSKYRVRCAVASTFFKNVGGGRILLAGDAGHVHSPAGGQGMNLGICDAIALGHTIHSHVKESVTSPEKADLLLSQYSSSRRETAIKVIGMTKGLLNVITVSSGWRSLRNTGLWVADKLPYLSRVIAWRVSGLGHR